MPLKFDKRTDLYTTIKTKNIEKFHDVSAEIVDFLTKILHDTENYVLAEFLKHPLFSGYNKFKTEDFKFNIVLDTLTKFTKQDKLVNFLII